MQIQANEFIFKKQPGDINAYVFKLNKQVARFICHARDFIEFDAEVTRYLRMIKPKADVLFEDDSWIMEKVVNE